jgi:hypothetical protein
LWGRSDETLPIPPLGSPSPRTPGGHDGVSAPADVMSLEDSLMWINCQGKEFRILNPKTGGIVFISSDWDSTETTFLRLKREYPEIEFEWLAVIDA